jgi:hypothetical protein
MAQMTKTDMMTELAEMGEYFWAGEAEIATTFLTGASKPEDHILWLKHQCFRELRGPGILKRQDSRTDWFIKNVQDGLPAAETREGREEMEHQLEQIQEEFSHFKFYADILEDITGEPVSMKELRELGLPSDGRLEAMRKRFLDENPKLAHLAFGFTEGGGAGIFYAAAVLETDDPLLLRVKRAGKTIYNDEVGHYEHNVDGLELALDDEAECRRLREMVVEICEERLRMRSEMHGMTMSEERIKEIAAGKIEPLKPRVIP